MNYIKLHFSVADQDKKDTLLAMLSLHNFEGFEETEDGLEAFVEEASFEEEAVNTLAAEMNLTFGKELIAKRNWNEEWEKNFEPVIINNFCSVRADFHPKPENVLYDIVITPKMSFGTGHHATTALMMTFMKELDFSSKKVFDFGTGTGILAILAEQLGAASVLAIDNDEWSVENATENCEKNHASKVRVQINPIEEIETPEQFDIILANINRHILLAYMTKMFELTIKGGTLLLSGILPEDIDMVQSSAVQTGFVYKKHAIENNWVCMHFEK